MKLHKKNVCQGDAPNATTPVYSLSTHLSLNLCVNRLTRGFIELFDETSSCFSTDYLQFPRPVRGIMYTACYRYSSSVRQVRSELFARALDRLQPYFLLFFIAFFRNFSQLNQALSLVLTVLFPPCGRTAKISQLVRKWPDSAPIQGARRQG